MGSLSNQGQYQSLHYKPQTLNNLQGMGF